MVGKRKSLGMAKKLRTEFQDEFFSRVRLEKPAAQSLQLRNERSQNQQQTSKNQEHTAGALHAGGEHGPKETGQRVRPDYAVDYNLQWQRRKQSERRSENAQQENPTKVGPVRPRLSQQSHVDMPV